jgi:SpoVK/Ycf46/Vps4 family AAA+-type ATPase
VSSDSVLDSLRAAVDAAPDDLPLRMHLAQLLVAAGNGAEAVRQAGAVLQRDPSNAKALALIRAGAVGPAEPEQQPSARASPQDDLAVLDGLEAQLSDVVPPMFSDGASRDSELYPVEMVRLRLADVGGMDAVKARLEAAVLAPMRNPELVRLYGMSRRGGLLLYGPPGCGKTFIARALAGEMGAAFLSLTLADVLDMYIGQSERNLHELFETARRHAPCVVFLDELDALGLKRNQLRQSAARGTVTQLLTEMDGVGTGDDGVFVLGATNHPWDVDVALRRPGRFDRMLLVLPPDEPARAAILRHHLQGRLIANIDLVQLATQTAGYSGADLAYVCETAAERVLIDSARTGSPRMIEMSDLQRALPEVRPSIGPWLETARNVAQFANEGGAYDDLLAYLRERRMV